MTVRDAGLTQGWDLHGSPDDTRNFYARLYNGAETASSNRVGDDHIDQVLFDGLCDHPGPSTPSVIERTFDMVSEEENPFCHECDLG